MSIWLVVGLGNPGIEYDKTRHNCGFMVADELARRANASFKTAKGMYAYLASTTISSAGLGIIPGEKLLIAKPITFMNDSGKAIKALCNFHNIQLDHLIVIHDELDLDLGQLRVKLGGSDNGHNGLKSIKQHMQSGDYYRVRFGIGRPAGRSSVIDYVLGTFAKTQLADVAIAINNTADACETLITKGLVATQNNFNN